MLAYISGSVDEGLLKRNEYLLVENRLLRDRVQGKLKFTDPERIKLAKLGKALGRKALKEVCAVAKPDTILAWHRKFVAQKFDGSKNRGTGRPRIDSEVEQLIVRMAEDNPSWGYDRIVGALALSPISTMRSQIKLWAMS